MKLAILKPLRVFISLIFFALVAFPFLDFTHLIPAKVTEAILYLQFGPSLVRMLNTAGWLATGFLVVLVLTMVFGRVYCSSICPLGTLQDFIAWANKRFTFFRRKNKSRKPRYYHFSAPANKWRYGLLAGTVLSWLGGSIFIFNLLDPFSNFGRIMANFTLPAYQWLHNQAVALLESWGYFFLFPATLRAMPWPSIVWPVLLFGLITWLAWKHGRLYCNTVCPVGSLLGLVAKYAIFQLKIDTSSCTNCALCVADCKANCIDRKSHQIDYSRCVACFNCLPACDEGAISFVNTWKTAKKQQEQPVLPKRQIASGLLGWIATAGLLSWAGKLQAAPYPIGNQDGKKGKGKGQKHLPGKPGAIPVIRNHPVTPPGATSQDNFTSFCTACGLCVSACPTHVLQPSFLEYGWLSIMQPRMDYHSGFCNFDCTICTDICPTQALAQFTSLEAKQRSQIGKVVFVEDSCIVFTDRTDCGACSEHCPPKAVDMKKCKGSGLMKPVIDETICIGCGACEYACPTQPFKAIYVEGNPLHLTAEAPQTKELMDNEPLEEFPF